MRELLSVEQLGGSSPAAERKQNNWSITSVLGYGVTADLAIFGVLPFINNELRQTENSALTKRKASGIGDAQIFGRYTIFKKDWIGRTLRVAPFFGVEMPTGEDDSTDALGRLPARVQTGSGSWDPFGGIVISWQTLDFAIDADASYKINTKANKLAFGDVMRLDASIQYRTWPGEVTSDTKAFLYSILEIGFVHADKDKLGGMTDPNSGGTSLFITPGVQYVARRWVLEAGIQIPLKQNLGGSALQRDFVFRSGVRFNF